MINWPQQRYEGETGERIVIEREGIVFENYGITCRLPINDEQLQWLTIRLIELCHERNVKLL